MGTDTEFEQLCRDVCEHCRRGYAMLLRHEKGHTLRFREDTQEWAHDFIKELPTADGIVFDHQFCQADKLRKNRGR